MNSFRRHFSSLQIYSNPGEPGQTETQMVDRDRGSLTSMHARIMEDPSEINIFDIHCIEGGRNAV